MGAPRICRRAPRGAAGALVSLVPLASLLLAGRADAFVRRVNDKSGAPVFWQQPCVPVTVYLNGFESSKNQAAMSPAAILKSVTEAAHAWSADAVTCPGGGSPSIEIVPTVAPLDAPAAPVAYDAKNVVIFRTDTRHEDWAKGGKVTPATPPYDPMGLAITTVTSEGDGHIVDVDVEINATNGLAVWMNLDPGVSPPAQQGDIVNFNDLQNALTHEFGHFVGLDHTCFPPDNMNPALLRPNDDQGHLVPLCDDKAPADVQASVMFNVMPPEQTSKRFLSPDDVRGVCAIYPPARATGTCALDQAPAAGCAVAAPPRAPGAELPASVVGLVLAAARGARRRAR
jgi:hypothetical protein